MFKYTVTPVPKPISTRLSKLAFKQRFTQAERIAIRQAATQSPVVYDFQDLLESATFVDLTRSDTIEGVQQLEAAQLLDEGRADEILTSPVESAEEWLG